MSFFKSVIICFCFFLCQFAVGQELYFNTFEPLQGLPSSETYQILQDTKGYIWITSDAGICRYDGAKLETFTIADGISENVVFNVYEDLHGRIWFSSLSGCLFYYENGKFIQIAANNQLKKICSPHPVSCFFVGENDTVYFTTPHVDGLSKIPPQNNYSQVIHQPYSCQNNDLFFLKNKLNPSQRIIGRSDLKIKWKAHLHSICYMNRVYSYLNKDAQANCDHIWEGRINRAGNMYLPVGNELKVINGENATVETHYFNHGIISVQEDREGDIWVGVKKEGGYLFKRGDVNSAPIHFLDSYSVCGIVLDREGAIWAATLERGVFQCFSKKVLEIHTPNEKTVGFQPKGNQLVISFSSGKQFIYSSLKNNRTDKDVKIPSNTLLNSFCSGKAGDYYGTMAGAFYTDARSGLKATYTYDNRSFGFTELFPISEDTVVATALNNFHILYRTKVLEKITMPFRISYVAKLKNNTILIGSKNNDGLYVLKDKSILPFLNNYPQLKTRINYIKEDEKGNLWIATNEKGLFCVDKNNVLFEFNETNGLVSNKVNCIDFENNNTIWMGTNKGLSKLIIHGKLKDTEVLNFNKSHGLPTIEINKLIVFNGTVWCGTKEYLFYYKSNEICLNTISPFVYFKSIFINNKQYDLSISPVLKYNENNVSMEFNAVTFKNNKQKSFLYKLEGYDNDWKKSETGVVQYTNLSHGKYHFLVYAQNSDKYKSRIAAEFFFTIKKPFWLTWWFIVIEVLFFAMIIYMIAKSWSNRIKKREEDKTLINQRIAEFQMTAIRAQMNPHFLFNAISSIQHYIFKNDPYESYNYLAKFSLLIRNVLDNSQQEYISIMKEIETLRLYIELEQIRFEYPFDFTIEIDERLQKEEFYVPTMLIQPYIENAIWHGLMPKKTNCTLSLSLRVINNEVQISITDNGIGREMSTKSKGASHHISKGMSLSNQRLDALRIKNTKIFSASIIDLKNEEGGALGTRVIITIPLIEF